MSGFGVLDIIFIAVIALGAINGYRLGFVRQVTRLFGAVIAYFVSYWLRPYVAPVVENMHLFSHLPQSAVANTLFGNLSGAIAFGVVFIVTFLLLRYAAGLIDALFSLPVLSFVNRTVGLVAGVALAVIFVYVVSLIMHYVNTPGVQHLVNQSRIARWLTGNAWQFVSHIGSTKNLNV
ncbi:CvpA family protein [Alicyclobacillus dauci]|uniref:CvpA family protein n=1 Tax=Alicyclobacillus dauci TaxID=1475485 RepID=A0ABY6Z726_9BACL|nr:CvpA family protein [Alicyclobacillus dauci]WAH38407.1 CvpA family protein [Alicyclobacillus dauci]